MIGKMLQQAAKNGTRLLSGQVLPRKPWWKRFSKSYIVQTGIGDTFEKKVGPRIGQNAHGDMQRDIVGRTCLVHPTARNVSSIAGAQLELKRGAACHVLGRIEVLVPERQLDGCSEDCPSL